MGYEKHYKLVITNIKKNVHFCEFLVDIFNTVLHFRDLLKFSLLKYYKFLECMISDFSNSLKFVFYHDARFKLCFYGNYLFRYSSLCCDTSRPKDSNWIITSSRPEVFLEFSQNSEENICARVSFLIKLHISGLQLY